MRLRCAMVPFAAAILSTLPLHAAAADAPQKEADSRVCAPADLAGTYVQIDFRETPPDGETQRKQQFPYAYLQFRREQFYGMLAVASEVTAPAQLASFMASVKFMKYTLSNDGILTLPLNETTRFYYRCIVSLKDAGDYRKGDLVFLGYSKGRKNELYRHYRRWF